MDNVFVFVVIFAFFGVPLKYQYRVLFWGILGAIVMRLTFILAAARLLALFRLGVLLVRRVPGLHRPSSWPRSHGARDASRSKHLRAIRRQYLRVAPGSHGDQFLRPAGRQAASSTSLFLVLLVIESTDVLFAIDSVPAIFGITNDPFIVFTSNIFAIMGLRALYFLLAGVMTLFRYLNYGLSAILVFIGVKMLLHRWWEPNHWLSLGDHRRSAWNVDRGVAHRRAAGSWRTRSRTPTSRCTNRRFQPICPVTTQAKDRQRTAAAASPMRIPSAAGSEFS